MPPKIFVISLHRTMTRSTDILLSMLGYRTLHFPKFSGGSNLMEAVRGLEDQPRRVVDTLTPAINERDALSDVPIPGLYRELAERWPDSRFILVTRDPWQWARSVRGHMKRRVLSPFNQIQYRPYFGQSIKRMTDVSEQELAAMHDGHTKAIRSYFEQERGEPERLCVASMAEGEVGERICNFLGHPPSPLPNLSGRPSEQDLQTARDWVMACPSKSDAHYMLASNLLHFGNTEEAMNHLRRAVAAEPDQPKPYALISEILIAKGDSAGAAEAAERALSNGLYRPRLFYRASAGHLRQGQIGVASSLWARGLVRRIRGH